MIIIQTFYFQNWEKNKKEGKKDNYPKSSDKHRKIRIIFVLIFVYIQYHKTWG